MGLGGDGGGKVVDDAQVVHNDLHAEGRGGGGGEAGPRMRIEWRNRGQLGGGPGESDEVAAILAAAAAIRVLRARSRRTRSRPWQPQAARAVPGLRGGEWGG